MPWSVGPASVSRWNKSYGRTFARILCAVFALIGALPLLGGYLVRSRPVLDWAAGETARILRQQLGVEARYRVEMQLWPLELSLHDVVIPSNDEGAPALEATRMAVTPRIFSLLAGRLDVGDIEIDEPRSRLVIREGRVVNVDYDLPEPPKDSSKLERAPFASVAVSDAHVDLDIDGIRIGVTAADLDVFAEYGPSFEVAFRAGTTILTRKREIDDGASKAVDEDVLCRTEARVRIDPDDVLIRRLSALGAADADPAAGTRPSCEIADDSQRVAVRLSQVRIVPREDEPPTFHGHAFARGPGLIVNRFVDASPVRGWVGITGDVSWDGTNELPNVTARVRGEDLGFDKYDLAKRLDADVRIAEDVIRVPRVEWDFAFGTTIARDTEIRPFNDPPTLHTAQVDGTGLKFEGFMRDLGVTPNTIVHWNIDRVHVENFGGSLDPLQISGYSHIETSDFEITDRAYHAPGRQHMLGIHQATLRGGIRLVPNAFEFVDQRADFGNSSLTTSVSIGFDEVLMVSVAEGSKVDLRDISPLIDIEWGGTASLEVFGAGPFANPLIKGKLAIDDFEFGGFPIGDIKSGNVEFRPLKLAMTDVHATKGKSTFHITTGLLDFDQEANVIADAIVESSALDLRDFLAMWHFDADPRFDPLFATGKASAKVHYALGGPEDVCETGILRVDGALDMEKLDLFEERYDSGKAKFNLVWDDIDASHRGMTLDVPSATLSKGSGTILTSLTVRPGAVVRGHAIATNVPLSQIQTLGLLGPMAAGRVSAVSEVYGTIDDLAAESHVRVSPVRVGSAVLPASDFAVGLVPENRPKPSVGTTRCGQPVNPPFDVAEFRRDERDGAYHLSGQMFGGQIELDDVQITRQRSPHVSGRIVLDDFDVGATAELVPAVALSDTKPEGKLSAEIVLDDLPKDAPADTKGRVTLKKLAIVRGGFRTALLPGAEPIVVENRRLEVPHLALRATTPGGQQGTFDMRAVAEDLGPDPRLDAELELRPADLSAFAGLIPRAERAGGTIRGRLEVDGPLSQLRYHGGVSLEDGHVSVRGFPVAVTDIDLALVVDEEKLRIAKGSADMGGGTVSIGGSIPMRDYALGQGRATMTLRGVSLPLDDGVRGQIDANLAASLPLGEEETVDGRPPLPRVTGDILVRSFEYTRPVTMKADLSSLTKRGTRTEFEAYDPADDMVEFDVTLRSARAMRVHNNLVDAKLEIGAEGLSFAGTNQRYGMRGAIRVNPGGRIQFRRNEFMIREGSIRFDDPTTVDPLVDVTAVTEYRRYSGASSTAATGASAAAGGRWDITMHAHGDANNLQIDLTSSPELGEDDIFLLLTVGLTRAELDQAQQAAAAGTSVALEALGTLTGTDEAVTEAVPVIDDFSFGSQYSSRTGRTEPTITIGKRLAERIRAQVTSGLSESRQVGSQVQWQVGTRTTVEAAYDNQNDISSSGLGNLGADIRWRLEFD